MLRVHLTKLKWCGLMRKVATFTVQSLVALPAIFIFNILVLKHTMKCWDATWMIVRLLIMLSHFYNVFIFYLFIFCYVCRFFWIFWIYNWNAGRILKIQQLLVIIVSWWWVIIFFFLSIHYLLIVILVHCCCHYR